jgi:Protein tyrosine and serine/threonine kinase
VCACTHNSVVYCNCNDYQAWTAPEIFDETRGASHFTAKSDVYSYAIVIFEVLCGAYPVALHGNSSSNSSSTNSTTNSAESSNMPW